MRISHIKLAGFKSFVDPTVLKLPAELTCIVGPNGCGKSNIIDAINWVLGESSAKHLRGESMADVIFSGSSNRKPVGQASVEIVFDNSDGTIAGQYAGYNEISIRRQVNRDGSSAYFLNGVRCRRKDVTNVFLGTGLGSRGYSIIEQGMISRVIEARPEDLRAFLEEAAGISKYKERRRETENRIRHTVDNLDRVRDILGELETQLNRLQRQAQAAEKYKTLAAEQRQLEAELAALSLRDLRGEAQRLALRVAERETVLTRAQSELAEAQSAASDLVDARDRSANRVAEAQRGFYEVSSQIDRAEQALKYRRERAESLRHDSERLAQELAELGELRTRDGDLLTSIREALTARTPELAEAKATHEARRQELTASEAAFAAWQSRWDELNLARSEALRTRELASARLEQARAGAARLYTRREALEGESAGFDLAALAESAASARHTVEALEAARDQTTRERQSRQVALESARESVREANHLMEDVRAEVQESQIQLASLRALQDADLGVDSETWVAALRELGLADTARAFSTLDIDHGFESAVSAAARLRVDAFVIEPEATRALLSAHPEQSIDLLFGAAGAPAVSAPAGLAAVTDFVRGEHAAMLFAGCWFAETREAALAAAPTLDPRELIVTRDGSVFGRGWLRIAAAETGAVTNVLTRASEIETAEAQLVSQEARLEGARETLASAQTRVRALEDEIARTNAALDELARRLSAAGQRENSARAQLDRSEARANQVARELADIERELAEHAERAQEAETARDSAAAAVAQSEAAIEAERGIREEHQRTLTSAREAQTRAREGIHSLELELERLQTQVKNLEQSVAAHATRQHNLESRRETLAKSTEENNAPIPELEVELQQAVTARGSAEERLNQAKAALADLDEKVRNSERARQAMQAAINAASEALTEVQLEQRAVAVRVQDVEARLTEMEANIDALLAALPADAAPDTWEEQVASVVRKITRLGPINMAAIEEFAQLDERKTYLDRQHADLTEALDTLRDAINTIDRETRTRFKETFDRVNDTMKALFPRLFGGGHAYLELTSEDMLEAGVAVMARPPGKRNATIHLLSGGEKALTAIAFVFSIFELNPAPFCLLDEVDAPLDDSNVVRLTQMLKEMAQRVQFAVVTHNKITMEIGQQLIGVTMNEPGVSRLVSVSMEEAVDLAQTA